MTVAGSLASGRRLALSLMVDLCTITRVTGTGTLNETTGKYTPTTTTVYSGPCRFVRGATQARDVDSQSQQVVVSSDELHLPIVGTADVRDDDIAAVTISAFDDAVLRARIVSQADGSLSVMRRLAVEVVA